MALPTGAKGSSALVRQPDRVTWDPNRGATRYAVWESIDSAKIDLQAAQARACKMPYNISSTGTTYRIEIEVVGGGTSLTTEPISTDRWEMPSNELQKSIWQHNKSLSLGSDPLVISERHLQDGKTLRECLDDMLAMDPNPIAGWSATDYANHASAYNLASSGSTHFYYGQYVLRHTTNASAAYAQNVADLNVEKLYTTDQLLIECTNPCYWVQILPGRLQYKIQNIPAPPARTGYLWSWRKLPSAEGSTATGRIEIVTEYWLEQWSTYAYTPIA